MLELLKNWGTVDEVKLGHMKVMGVARTKDDIRARVVEV